MNNTIPTILMRQGDFTEIGSTIYDPNSLREVDGKFFRDPFPGNIIPLSQMDPVSAQAKDWYPDPKNDRLTQNFLYNPPARGRPEPGGRSRRSRVLRG